MNPVFTALSYVLWFLATYYVVFFLILLFSNKHVLHEGRRLPRNVRPTVTIIAPAYNEEGKIHQTIASLKRLTYPNVEFIIVNDGSRDGTAAEVRAAIGKDSRFRFIDRAENRGKAASLNQGIAAAKGEYVACMDADSMLEPRMLEKTLPYIIDQPRIGAVTVSVAVHKPRSILEKVIQIEYIIGLSLYLKVLSKANLVFVTPGPFSLYRKSMLQEIGGFDTKNITEDLEIAYRIHKAGYRIENCMEATVRTIVPPGFKAVYVQRRRWYSGAIATLYQHRSMLFSRKHGAFGWFVPFNYVLTFLGLIVAYIAIYLTVTNVWNTLVSFQYTGFNILERMSEWQFDIFKIKTISLIGFTSILISLAILAIGIVMTQQNVRRKKTGIFAYLWMSILYLVWWTGATIAVMRGKKITWR